MAEVSITVRGSAESSQRPERATVRLAVDVDGPDREEVFASATTTAARIAASIEPLFERERGPVTWWASDQVHVWWERPWNREGQQLPPVHHAGVEFRVKFADFDAMGRWLGEIAVLERVSLHGIEWTLTEARCVELTERTRAAAVRAARDKAAMYASSLGLGEVRPVAVADVGMLGNHPATEFGGPPMRHASAAAGGGAELRFTPQDVTVACDVDARFLAG